MRNKSLNKTEEKTCGAKENESNSSFDFTF